MENIAHYASSSKRTIERMAQNVQNEVEKIGQLRTMGEMFDIQELILRSVRINKKRIVEGSSSDP